MDRNSDQQAVTQLALTLMRTIETMQRWELGPGMHQLLKFTYANLGILLQNEKEMKKVRMPINFDLDQTSERMLQALLAMLRGIKWLNVYRKGCGRKPWDFLKRAAELDRQEAEDAQAQKPAPAIE